MTDDHWTSELIRLIQECKAETGIGFWEYFDVLTASTYKPDDELVKLLVGTQV